MKREFAELDLAVAQADGRQAFIAGPHYWQISERGLCLNNTPFDTSPYQPTRDGGEAMRLLEKYRLTVGAVMGGGWSAFSDGVNETGSTPAIAICRAVVALRKKS